MRFNRKSVAVTTSTDADVVSLADMRAALRISDTCNDQLIQDCINSATVMAKEYLRVALRTETFVVTMDGFGDGGDDRLDALGPGVHTISVPYVLGGCGEITLPFGPVQSITSIKTVGRDNTEATFSAANYSLDPRGARVFLNEGASWPTDLRDFAAVSVTYVGGYGAASVPAPIVHGIKALAQSLFDGCGDMPDAVKAMLAPYRRLDDLAW